MVTLNKPSAGDTDWTTEINNNWTSIENLLNGLVTKVKSADESVTSSTTLQDDNELTFSIGANETWQFELVIFVTVANATPDINVGLNGPGTPTALRAQVQGWNFNSTGTTSYGGILTSYGVAIDIQWAQAADTALIIKGSVTNGGTAGTFAFQWAQRVSSATATVVKRGSYLVAHKV